MTAHGLDFQHGEHYAGPWTHSNEISVTKFLNDDLENEISVTKFLEQENEYWPDEYYPEKEWEHDVESDSDFSGDEDDYLSQLAHEDRYGRYSNGQLSND